MTGVTGRLPHRTWALVALLGFYLRELLAANLRLAREVLTPRAATRPAIVAVPIRATGELEVAVLANMITLTPGTLTLDVADTGDVLYVHVTHLDAVDELRLHIRSMEQRLLGVLR